MRAARLDRNEVLRLIGATALVLVTSIVYARAVRGEFQFDDELGIERNLRIKDLSRFVSPSAWDPTLRPLTEATFAVNYAIGGLDTVGFHVVNIAIHLVGVLLVFLLGRRTLELAGLPRSTWVAAAAASAFALHPLQTETVSYVVQRSEALASVFVVAGVLALRRAEADRGWRLAGWAGAAVVCGAAGLAAKQMAATLPILYLLHSYAFPPRPEHARVSHGRRLLLAAPLVALSMLVAARMLLGPASAIPSPTVANAGFDLEGLGFREYVLTEAGVLFRYLRLAAWPSDLTVDPEVSLVRSLDAGAAIAVLALAALVIASALLALGRGPRAARTPVGRIVGFGILWFVVALLPTTVVPLADPMAEHRVYLAAWGPLLAAAVGLRAATAAFGAPPWARTGAALAVLAALALATWTRNAVWQAKVALWTDAVAKSPGKLRPKLNLAHAYALRGDAPIALDHYRAALATADVSRAPLGRVYRNMGVLLFQLGRTDEAARHFSAAASDPTFEAEARNNLAIVYLEKRMLPEARAEAERSLLLDPGKGAAQNTLGEILFAQGDVRGALARFEEAVRLDPDVPSRGFNLALALERLGRISEACSEWRRYLGAPSAPRRDEVSAHLGEIGCP